MPDAPATRSLAPVLVDALWREAEALREPMVEFARRLIRTPSLPGQEEAAAQLVAEEMRRLDYDEVEIDGAGNVIGRILAAAEGRERPASSVMFNSHMDHVDVGDEARWPHPPYEAVVDGGHIYGRGSSDLKGSLACQVYAGGLLKRLKMPLPNDIYVVGVVQEELGGLGSAYLAERLRTDYAVIGEPSANRLALGHRGRFEVQVTIVGKSVHASVPESGVNPLYSVARFLSQLEKLTFAPDPNHPALGATSLAPTLIVTDQTSANVVPGFCKMVLDVRNTPADEPDAILERVQTALSSSLEPGARGSAEIPLTTLKSYSGVSKSFRVASMPFGISPDDALVRHAEAALGAALRRPIETEVWRFATDAGHLVATGIAVIGFGPGYEEVIHTVDERISIDMMVEGLVANAALAVGLT